MNKLYSYGLSAALLLTGLRTHAQNQDRPVGPAFSLGTSQALVRQLESQVTQGAQRQASTVALQVSAATAFTGKVNYREDLSSTGEYVVGEIQGVPGSSFMVRIEGTQVEGHIILRTTKQAYRYSSDAQGNASVQEVDIDKVICIGYEKPLGYQEPAPAPGSAAKGAAAAAVASLQSLPGARGCVMLDLDGQYVSGTGWNNGNPINAAPAVMVNDAAKVQALWELVSEDFRPFSINVTTDEAVFNSYPKNMRMRCIITPTNTAAPGAGGVAYVTSFNFNDDTPCWVFMSDDPKASGEAASHEVGHTLGLSHDARPGEGYYAGQGLWAPIMGVGYYKPVSQWSRGEYNQANQKQDDLAIMSGPTYNVGYRADDHANAASGATALARNGTSVSGSGIIERTVDQDYFSFTTGGGAVSLNVNTVGRYGNLDIVARLFTASGTLIGTFDTPAGTNAPNLNATVSATLGAGTYYLQVDGTGSGDPATNGYSDYGSLGTYTIAGTIPAGGTSPQPSGVVTLYRDCPFSGTSVSLPVGDYNLAALQARGIRNDDISSVRVSPGYEVALFENDNFQGASITAFDEECLVNRSFNDRTSSIRVRTVGTATLYQDCGFGGYAVVLPAIGSYTTNQLLALNFRDNDISALKVNSSFEVVLYENDNLGGASLTVGANTDCLVAAGWNDRVSSILVRNVGSAATAATGGDTPAAAAGAQAASAPADVEIYPNPVADRLFIRGGSNLAGSEFNILDALGRSVAKGSASADGVRVASLKPGVYTLMLVLDGKTLVTRRFVK